MIEELQSAIVLQLDVLHKQIAMERELLAREDDREESACRRERIAQTEVLLKRIETMRTEIMQSESEAERAAQNFAEWRRLVVEIRGLTKTRDELARKIRPLQEEADLAFARLDAARQELAAHRQRKFGPLALEREHHEHQRELGRLETDFEKKRTEHQTATEKLGSVQSATLQLSREIDGLGWKANRLAPDNVTRLDPDRASVMSIV